MVFLAISEDFGNILEKTHVKLSGYVKEDS